MPIRWPISDTEVSQLPRWPIASLSLSCARADWLAVTAIIVATQASRFRVVMIPPWIAFFLSIGRLAAQWRGDVSPMLSHPLARLTERQFLRRNAERAPVG